MPLLTANVDWTRSCGELLGVEKRIPAEYEADIREEPIRWLGEQDVTTRNRYGAEVLNSRSCAFFDVDDPVLPIWQIFRRRRGIAEKKAAILKFLRKRLQGRDLGGFGVRLYETHNGMRVLLHGRTLDPRSAEARRLFKVLHADHLDALLCRKQNCYRARLTPKPHRIKMGTIRLRFPYSEAEVAGIEQWTSQYRERSTGFAVCRLVEVLARAPLSHVVRYHDEMTHAESRLPLA